MSSIEKWSSDMLAEQLPALKETMQPLSWNNLELFELSNTSGNICLDNYSRFILITKPLPDSWVLRNQLELQLDRSWYCKNTSSLKLSIDLARIIQMWIPYLTLSTNNQKWNCNNTKHSNNTWKKEFTLLSITTNNNRNSKQLPNILRSKTTNSTTSVKKTKNNYSK